ncbi:MAG: DNA-3-methyladenine glycosylase [Candidatus Dadabacteria bacterium]|nr:MAG: DNA-3-methyladenine glycosylase [Candidatus Dadabacteria bacterium]
MVKKKDKISRSFFLTPTVLLAKKLLGWQIFTKINGVITGGIIVETEAYHGPTDEACHCHYGKTKRNEVMFKEGGHLYVYFTYGMHYCANIVAEKEGIGAAVLLRALEPTVGIETMLRRRKVREIKDIANGPAKLCQALKLTSKLNGEDLLSSSRVWLVKPRRVLKSQEIQCAERIGISKAKDLPWRFFIKDNKFVSVYPKHL